MSADERVARRARELSDLLRSGRPLAEIDLELRRTPIDDEAVLRAFLRLELERGPGILERGLRRLLRRSRG